MFIGNTWEEQDYEQGPVYVLFAPIDWRYPTQKSR